MNESERELLERARTALSPTEAQRAALRARIDAAVAAPPSGGGRFGAGAFGAGGVALGLVAVGVLAGGVAWLTRAPQTSPAVVEAPAIEAPAIEAPAIEEPAIEEATPALRVEISEASEAVAPLEAVAALEPGAALEPVVVAPEVAPAHRRTTSAPTAAVPAPGPAAEDALAREVALVGDARRALSRGDGAAANAALERHAREFPEGVLAEERSALSVLAWCAAGEEARAVSAARAFLNRYPASLSTARVRASCAGPSL